MNSAVLCIESKKYMINSAIKFKMSKINTPDIGSKSAVSLMNNFDTGIKSEVSMNSVATTIKTEWLA